MTSREPDLRILFVTWDGPQVSYLESLFLPIFAGLRQRGAKFDVLQFRWGNEALTREIGELCRSHGIGYRAVPVWRWGGAAGPFLSAIAGGRHVRRAVREFGSDVVMPRGMMPSISALSAGGRKLRPLLFDADGLPTDERVDVSGLPATGATYRILRDIEAQTVRLSTSVLVRTRANAEILYHRAGPPVTPERFHVVANGRDEGVFHPFDEAKRAEVRRELGIAPEAPLLVYAGSLGPQYRLDAMKALFQEVRRLRADARFLLLTGSPEQAREALGEEGEAALVMRVAPGEVPRFLAASDVGLAYRAISFSMQGVAPVKLSEYLLCGLPVIGTAAIGDTGAVAADGLFFDDAGGGTAEAARWLVEDVLTKRESYRDRTRAAGQAHFSLGRSIEDYARALEPLRGNGKHLGAAGAPTLPS
jgi:glycosyltransferase involved in cell wall biosynthesis